MQPGSTARQLLLEAASAFLRRALSGFLIVLLCHPGPAPATPPPHLPWSHSMQRALTYQPTAEQRIDRPPND